MTTVQTYTNKAIVTNQGVTLAYLALVKMRLTSMVVFTAVAAYAICSGSNAEWLSILLLIIGGFAITGASNAMNQVLEKDYDRLMTRTANRPIVTERISMSHGVLFAGFLCLLGITILALFNALTAFLGMLSFVLYSFVYTPLKRHSSAAVTIGAIAGAMPLLIGSVAYEGGITWLALSLFIIQFAWQFPHFWAIGFLGYTDYKKAGFEFIPAAGELPNKSIALNAVVYCILLGCCMFGMYYIGLVQPISLLLLLSMTIAFGYYAVLFYRLFDFNSAKKLMFASLFYIPLALIILIIQNLLL